MKLEGGVRADGARLEGLSVPVNIDLPGTVHLAGTLYLPSNCPRLAATVARLDSGYLHIHEMKDTFGTISNPRQLATLPDILGALSVLQSHESDLSASLTELLSTYEPIEASLSSLQSLGPQLDALSRETQLLDETVSYTARTAQDVGGRVQSLDEEMRRVREASERVSQIIELKVRTGFV